MQSILLFVVVRFYKAVLNTELAETETLLIGERQRQICVSLWSHNTFVNQSTLSLCFMCVAIKDTLFKICASQVEKE